MRDPGRIDDLTDRQQQMLSALRRLTERDGYAPTLRELGAEVGVTSPSTVLHHVRVLESLELLERRPHLPRTTRLRDLSGTRAPASG